MEMREGIIWKWTLSKIFELFGKSGRDTDLL